MEDTAPVNDTETATEPKPETPTVSEDMQALIDRQQKTDEVLASVLEQLKQQSAPKPDTPKDAGGKPPKESKETAMQGQIKELQEQIKQRDERNAANAKENETLAIARHFTHNEVLLPLIKERIGYDEKDGKIFYKDMSGDRKSWTQKEFLDSLKKLKGMEKHIPQTQASGMLGARQKPHTPTTPTGKEFNLGQGLQAKDREAYIAQIAFEKGYTL